MRRFARQSVSALAKDSALALSGKQPDPNSKAIFGHGPPHYRPLINRGNQMISSGKIAKTSIPSVMIHTNGQDAR